MTDDWLGCYLFPDSEYRRERHDCLIEDMQFIVQEIEVTLFPDSEPQKKKRTPKQAKHDAVWDAVVAVFFPEGGAESQKGRVANLVAMAKDYFKEMGLENIHRDSAVAILAERKRLYVQHPYWSKQPHTPESILKHWNDVAEGAGVTLRRLCAEWLGTIRQDAQVLSSSFDDTDRLVVWLLFQEEAGELKAKRPDVADAAAFMLERFRRKYTYATGRPIRRAVEELRELA